MRIPFVLLLVLLGLAGCVETAQRGGYYDDDYYGRPGYYQGYPRGRNREYYNDQDAYERRRRHEEAVCNTRWANCVNVCNSMRDANQRAVCVANCNNALNQCKR
ncbi:MAG: hypothetical protein ACLGQW_03955 [Acidobacteriota bacterium]